MIYVPIQEGCKNILKFITLYAPVNHLQSSCGTDIVVNLSNEGKLKLIECLRIKGMIYYDIITINLARIIIFIIGNNSSRCMKFIPYIDSNLTKFCIEHLLYCLQVHH